MGKEASGAVLILGKVAVLLLSLIAAVLDYLFPPKKATSVIPAKDQSVVLPDGERRSHLNNSKLLFTLDQNVTTLYENFRRGMSLAGDKPCMGHREAGTGPYVWQTYKQVAERMTNFGSGLIAMGVKPGQDTFVGLYSQNRAEWVIAEQAANCYSMVTVPLYDTLGFEAVKFIVGQAGLSVIVAEESKLAVLLKVKAAFDSDVKNGVNSSSDNKDDKAIECPVKFVVKMTDVKDGEKEAFAKVGLTLVSFTAVEKAGADKKIDHVPPKDSYVATICYTSGTTGNPKGAMLLHQNLIADCAGVMAVMRDVPALANLNNDDALISFLPLAHMFERMMQVYMWFNGARVGFYSGDVKLLTKDMLVLQPTIFPCVPRLLNRIHAGVMGKPMSPVISMLFKAALAYKRKELANSVVRKDSLWDMLVFKQIHSMLGGKVKLIITGAAPISAEVLTDLRAFVGCPIFEAYGQTECTAGSNISIPGDHTAGHVGPPLPCNEVKLMDVEEMELKVSVAKRGEICYRGPNVFAGYFKDKKKTAEALDSDGWLHSGDIGTWLENGQLKIVDRKKSIFKLAQGEYVAPEKIENVYILDGRIAQAFVWGDSHQASLVGIFVVEPSAFTAWANGKGFQGDAIALIKSKEVTKALLAETNLLAKAAGLTPFELVKAVRLTTDAFTVENNLLTPTFKTKRPQITALYRENVLKDLIGEVHAMEEQEKKNIKA